MKQRIHAISPTTHTRVQMNLWDRPDARKNGQPQERGRRFKKKLKTALSHEVRVPKEAGSSLLRQGKAKLAPAERHRGHNIDLHT